MDQLLNQFNLNFSEDFSIVNYVVNILICGILLWILSLVYVRFGRSISNRGQLGRVLILVGVTTFIIISIVKSSLALSLGLVGALSIVRFRTAIKEPEELGYFFIAISIGLGMGANQLLPTLLGFVLLIIIIIATTRKMYRKTISQNLVVALQCDTEDRSKFTDLISETVLSHANQVDLKRLNYSEEGIHFNFHVNVPSIESISRLNDDLTRIDKNIGITFLDSEI